jgi:hypothetical protein
MELILLAFIEEAISTWVFFQACSATNLLARHSIDFSKRKKDFGLLCPYLSGN